MIKLKKKVKWQKIEGLQKWKRKKIRVTIAIHSEPPPPLYVAFLSFLYIFLQYCIASCVHDSKTIPWFIEQKFCEMKL